MRALVTGATGFVGSHLVRRLLAGGCQVAVLVRNPGRMRRIGDVRGQLAIIPGELGSIARVSQRLASFAPDMVFHLGWSGANSHAFQRSPAQVYENVPGSLELVRAAAHAGCRKFIGLGSVLEYGDCGGTITESLDAKPANLYGAAKYSVGLLSEALCRPLGLDFAWLRVTWGYGPADDPARMIPGVITSLLHGDRPALTPGEQYWDYLYVDDLVEAIYRVATTERARGFLNVGSGEAVQVRAIAQLIRDEIDPRLPLGLGDIPYRDGQMMRLDVSIDRLKGAIDWAPRVSIEEGIRRTVQWHRQRVAGLADHHAGYSMEHAPCV
jgi:UDP-glucose 4-epimerase